MFKMRKTAIRMAMQQRGNGGKIMSDNHFAGVGKKDTMSLTLALIVLDRLNTTERIDIGRAELVEAVRVVTSAAKYRIPRKPDNDGFYSPFVCRACNCLVRESYAFCPDCGQAINWSLNQ
jgi:hypothetical protein